MDKHNMLLRFPLETRLTKLLITLSRFQFHRFRALAPGAESDASGSVGAWQDKAGQAVQLPMVLSTRAACSRAFKHFI